MYIYIYIYMYIYIRVWLMPQRFLLTPTFFMVECLHDISKLAKFQEIQVMEKSSPFQMKFWHIFQIC